MNRIRGWIDRSYHRLGVGLNVLSVLNEDHHFKVSWVKLVLTPEYFSKDILQRLVVFIWCWILLVRGKDLDLLHLTDLRVIVERFGIQQVVMPPYSRYDRSLLLQGYHLVRSHIEFTSWEESSLQAEFLPIIQVGYQDSMIRELDNSVGTDFLSL